MPVQSLFIRSTSQPTNVSVTEQATFDNINFGFFREGSISGVKFRDDNSNGVQDAGEPGLPGFTLYIDRNNNGVLDTGEPSTVSAADGSAFSTNGS